MTAQEYMLKVKDLVNKYHECKKQIKVECEKDNSLTNWLNGDKTIEDLKLKCRLLEEKIYSLRKKEELFNRGNSLMHLWTY